MKIQREYFSWTSISTEKAMPTHFDSEIKFMLPTGVTQTAIMADGCIDGHSAMGGAACSKHRSSYPLSSLFGSNDCGMSRFVPPFNESSRAVDVDLSCGGRAANSSVGSSAGARWCCHDHDRELPISARACAAEASGMGGVE
jgi:hypothetical protein